MKKKINLKAITPHIIAVLLFFAISAIYFAPSMTGKMLSQYDIKMHKGSAKEIADYRDRTGQEPLWTNSMFGGMPAYLISINYKYNLVKYAYRFISVGLSVPTKYLFLSLVGFYILLLSFKVDPWLGIAGAIAFGMSSYFFIVESAGHNSKALAMSYMPTIIAGVILAFRGKIYLGAILFSFFLALQLLADHVQITYYTFFIILIAGIAQLFISLKEKNIKQYIRAIVFLGAGIVLAIGSHFASIWSVYDYGKYSTRSKSELTINAEDKTGGLDRSYITGWSYGKLETFNLLIPNLMGGSSSGQLNQDSKFYELLIQSGYPANRAKKELKRVPLYWGPQSSTSGPAYVGAIVFFLFVFGLFLVKGSIKWWCLTATALSVLLAWGSNFQFFSDLFIDYFPGYNKFRSVTMILVIAGLTIPLLGFLAVKQIIDEEVDRKAFFKALKISTGIVGGICLIFLILPDMIFKLAGYTPYYGLEKTGELSAFDEALISDRRGVLIADAFRSLIYVLLSAVLIALFYLKKIKKTWFYSALIFLIVFDMWTVNRRYLNNDNFVSKKDQENPFKPSNADLAILQDKSNYRVLNLTVSPFNDASTSYFHKSLGGYHGAKMKRFQELIEYHISKNNLKVLDMLNCKYIIADTKEGPMPQINQSALGNAWFVDNAKIVQNADEEIKSLTDFNPRKEAIVDKRFDNQLKGFSPSIDSSASIKLVKYEPNYLKYESNSKSEKIAVFSEIYYDKGWEVKINGKPADYFRANYILRSMRIPAGANTIEFSFKPKSYYVGEKVSLASSSILLILLVLVLGLEIKNNKNIFIEELENENPENIEKSPNAKHNKK